MTIYEIKTLMQRYGLRPNKRLGQNFLVDPFHLSQIVAAAALEAGEVVLEIGPGLGALSEHLLAAGAQVVAVEVDGGFVALLWDRFKDSPRFELHHGDILKTMLSEVLPVTDDGLSVRYKCVANIPYNITSAVMRHLLENEVAPELIVLLMQKEVAQRIVATPGNLSLLAVSVQFYGTPEIMGAVPASVFYPKPKVDSAILRVRPHTTNPYDVKRAKLFWRVVKGGFSQKRKQLHNSLRASFSHLGKEKLLMAFKEADILPSRRAQTLSIDEWVALYQQIEVLMA